MTVVARGLQQLIQKLEGDRVKDWKAKVNAAKMPRTLGVAQRTSATKPMLFGKRAQARVVDSAGLRMGQGVEN